MIAGASHLISVGWNPAPRNSASWIGKCFSARHGSIRGVVECGREASATLRLGAAIIFVLALAASGCALLRKARSPGAASDGGFVETTTRTTDAAGSVEAASVAQFEAPSVPAAPGQPSGPGSPRAPAFPAPFAIAFGPDGNMWFTEFGSNRIGRVTLSGDVTFFDLRPRGIPQRLTAGPDEALWFTDAAGNRIGRLGLDGSDLYVPVPPPASGPPAIIPGPGRDLWFTEHAGNRIARITPLGTVTEFALPGPGDPGGIAIGPDRYVYFTESRGNRIDRMSLDGRVDEFPLRTPGSLPGNIVTGADGSLWFTELGTRKVGRLTTAGDVSEYTLPVNGAPLDITVGPDRNLWVTEPNGKIGRFSVDGTLTEFSLASKAASGK